MSSRKPKVLVPSARHGAVKEIQLINIVEGRMYPRNFELRLFSLL